jgi:hypothetical protein
VNQFAKLTLEISTGERRNDSPKAPESHITLVRRTAGKMGGEGAGQGVVAEEAAQAPARYVYLHASTLNHGRSS